MDSFRKELHSCANLKKEIGYQLRLFQNQTKETFEHHDSQN